MVDESVLPIPIEVPWQLAGTTLSLEDDAPQSGATSLSLFTYTPNLSTLGGDYPHDYLVYLKLSASISPDHVPGPDPVRRLFDEVIPVSHLVVDIRVRPRPAGGGRPYFLAAAPVRRSMIESGIVGGGAFEGESDALAVGRSGSQIHESFRTAAATDTSSQGFSVGPFAAGTGTTTGMVSGERDVVQQVDTTQRIASQERRELLSHTTTVNNVLTLLTAQYVGTPYLRFSLWPQPLRTLTVDPSDLGLWYAELLQRRSSGIEGMQDFFAIVVVPRAFEGFCIDARLTRVMVLPNNPIVPFSPGKPWPTGPNFSKVLEYLNRHYPPGTPLDDLDPPVERKPADRGAVWNWGLYTASAKPGDLGEVHLGVQSLAHAPGASVVEENSVPYKTAGEVWLALKREEYQAEMLRSPLQHEAPRVYYDQIALDTCFGWPVYFDADGSEHRTGEPGLRVVATELSADTQARSLVFSPTTLVIPEANTVRRGEALRRAIALWNALDGELATHLMGLRDWPEEEFRFDHPHFVAAFLRRAEALRPDHPANDRLDAIRLWADLSSEQVRALESIQVSDLRGLAAALSGSEAAPEARRQSGTHAAPPSREEQSALPIGLSADDAAGIRTRLGRALQAAADRQAQASVNVTSSSQDKRTESPSPPAA